MRQVEMIAGKHFSRRTLLRGAGMPFALPLLHAMQEAPPHSLEPLLNGSGMARIPAGEFLMGSRNGVADEQPVHRVRITRGFEMGKFEVTQAQWEAVMRDPHARPGTQKNPPDQTVVSANPSHFKGSALPVESVSWDDVQQFLRRLNTRDERHEYRLPTEAEWEYACRGGSTDDYAGTVDAIAWYKENSDERTQPVGQKKPNAWGLYDMRGNVAEWVKDWYGFDYYGNSPATDPPGPESGSYRVFRGGGWFDSVKFCRATVRGFDFPISRLYNVGFRLVRTAK